MEPVSKTVASAVSEALPPGSNTPVLKPGKARIAVGFMLNDTDAALIVDSEHILAGMTGNAAYPTPSPTMVDLTSARNAFIAAVSAAKDSRLAIGTRKQKRDDLVAVLRLLGHYVQVASAGDLPTLRSSGFPVQKQRQPVGELSAPGRVKFVRGKLSGQAIARCEKMPQAGAYVWRCAPAATPTAYLPLVITLSARAVFDGLNPLTQYAVQACAVGSAGQGNWSDAATVAVL